MRYARLVMCGPELNAESCVICTADLLIKGQDIARLFGQFEGSTRDGVPISRIFKDVDFGYRTITVKCPERDAAGKIALDTKGNGKGKGKRLPDAALRLTESSL